MGAFEITACSIAMQLLPDSSDCTEEVSVDELRSFFTEQDTGVLVRVTNFGHSNHLHSLLSFFT